MEGAMSHPFNDSWEETLTQLKAERYSCRFIRFQNLIKIHLMLFLAYSRSNSSSDPAKTILLIALFIIVIIGSYLCQQCKESSDEDRIRTFEQQREIDLARLEVGRAETARDRTQHYIDYHSDGITVVGNSNGNTELRTSSRYQNNNGRFSDNANLLVSHSNRSRSPSPYNQFPHSQIQFPSTINRSRSPSPRPLPTAPTRITIPSPAPSAPAVSVDDLPPPYEACFENSSTRNR